MSNAINWETTTSEQDDFCIKIGDYHLRVEQMDDNEWWYAVFYKDEQINDVNFPFVRSLSEAKAIVESIMLTHKSEKPLDLSSRLTELSFLKSGWLDGEIGNAIDKDGLEWLIEAFETNYNSEALPLPATFPTPEGNIQFEWSVNDYEVSLKVEIPTKKAEFYAIQITTESETAHDLDLDKPEAWIMLNQLMMDINEKYHTST
ncbi:MAG: hypothetical protein M9949_05990 [Candidatus Kapabacteria bacterium]|nr:hypothetical protein [Candidatus Kapabacteria bacterium]